VDRLTKEQITAAEKLKAKRPPTLSGTRAILDPVALTTWYDEVTQTMVQNAIRPDQVGEFCDIAGVPD